MARGAKQKGDGYERELAEYFNKMMHGGDKVVTRTPLSGGGIHTGKGDLEGLRYLSVEAKRTERFTPGPAMEQATAAAGDTKIPVVITRRNRVKTGDSWVMLKLDDFIPMYADYIACRETRDQDNLLAHQFYKQLINSKNFKNKLNQFPGDTQADKIKAMIQFAVNKYGKGYVAAQVEDR